MTDNDQNRILNRIKKMLALANDAGATEGERDNALRMAYATMSKHNFDMAQVDAVTGAKGTSDAAAEKREQIKKLYSELAWAREVSYAIARLFFCHYYFARVSGNRSKVDHCFLGRTSNAVTASEMSAYIVESIHKEASRFARHLGGQAHRDFCKGAVEKIVRRCHALRTEAETPVTSKEPGMALVLKSFYAKEQEANEQHLAVVLKIKTRKAAGGRGATNGDAYRSGQAFGSTVSLNRQVK